MPPRLLRPVSERYRMHVWSARYTSKRVPREAGRRCGLLASSLVSPVCLCKPQFSRFQRAMGWRSIAPVDLERPLTGDGTNVAYDDPAVCWTRPFGCAGDMVVVGRKG